MKNMDSSNAKHYYLERRGEDGKLLAKYTNELTLNDQIFNLNTLPPDIIFELPQVRDIS